MTSSLSQSLGGGSPVIWAEDFCRIAAFPLTEPNLQVVYSWEYAESGGGGGLWNPLNTTEPWPGATDDNSVGVKNYASRADGLGATATVIHQHYYTAVVASFLNGSSALATKWLIEASPWGTRHIDLLPLPLPPNAPLPGVDTMQLIASPHKATVPGRSPAAIWDPSRPNVVRLTNGASIAGDQPEFLERVWEPPLPPGTVGVGIAATVHRGGFSNGQPDGKGVFLQDSAGDTYIGTWS